MALNYNVSCGLINVQSVGNKTLKIRNLVNEFDLDICILTETWLRNDLSDSSKVAELTPETHSFLHVPRNNLIGGGVGVLLNRAFTKTKIIDGDKFQSFEHMQVVTYLKNIQIKLIVVYRPPNTSKRLFLDEISLFLDSLGSLDRTLICGDFNFWYDVRGDSYTSEFTDILDVNDLTNSVTTPTSRSDHILDLVIHLKDTEFVTNCSVEPECSISPFHKLVKFDLLLKKSGTMNKLIKYRNKSEFDANKLIRDCVSDINDMIVVCDCQTDKVHETGTECVSCYSKLSKNIMATTYDQCCPMVEKDIVIRDSSKWYTSELKKAKRERRRLEKRWNRKKTDESRERYVRARNDYNTLVEKTKKIHYLMVFRASSDSRTSHRTLDELLGIKGEKILPDYTNDNLVIAESFAAYFIEKVENIVAGLPPIDSNNQRIVQIRNYVRFSKFRTLSIDDFRKLSSNVKSTYCDNDPFPIKDLKNAENYGSIENVYFKITNMSLSQAVFPSSEKTAYVIPSYKNKGNKNELGSYRPISNLSYQSKLIESAVNEQTVHHLEAIDAIPDEQSAYRRHCSTETAIRSAVNNMIEIINKDGTGMLLMLDLSAAFDTVDHDLLLGDLRSIGISGDVYDWYESFLRNRNMVVKVNDMVSQPKCLKRGVPQGSVLGPTLFSIYTASLANILRDRGVKFIIYADDTQFCFPIEDINDAKRKIDEIMTDIRLWMVKRRLKLNESKTECMLFGSKNSLKNYHNFKTVTIGDAEVSIVSVVKNLGVLIDDTLSLKQQVMNTVKICNYHIRNIAFIHKYLDEDTLKMAISSYVISRLDYCNSVFYDLPKYLLKKLQGVQNKAARLIKGAKLRDRITPLLIDLHWLPMKARIEYKICLLVYKALKYTAPRYLSDCLKPYQIDTDVRVRYCDDRHRLNVPRTFNKLGDRAFEKCAPQLYNGLPSWLKDIDNVVQFKKELKTLMFERSFDLSDYTVKEQYKL